MPEVQEILQRFFSRASSTFKFSTQQNIVVDNIIHCRTEKMGAHFFECDNCGHQKVAYNSCGNRHCPTCQTLPKEKWIDKRKKDLVNSPYFHVVFTVPEELRMLVYQNQELMYSLMFRATSETLFELSLSEKHLGGQIGFISILHTWSQELDYHPHIHIIVLGGGLTKKQTWKQSSKDFFIHVDVLSKVFKGKFLDSLKRNYQENKLKFYKNLQELYNTENFCRLKDACYKKNWYVYCKEPFSGPEAVIEYLGRYTHKVAISNNRIVDVTDDKVTIRRKDRSTFSLSGEEFVRRFLMHVLPKRFVKIRHYGILGNKNKKTKLILCKRLTYSKVYKPKYEGLKTDELMKLITGRDIHKCPCCETGRFRKIGTLLKQYSRSP